MKTVFIDMDDTIADFLGHPAFADGLDISHMYAPGFFLSLKPMAGSHRAIRAILAMGYDVQILSQPVAQSAHSYSEKVQWIAMHFPELISKINLTQDKGLFVGHFLIDDNVPKWRDKFEANGGRFIYFNHEEDHEQQWNNIVHILELAK
jgi:5'(3')-deoxyribonucleotidase